MFEYVKYCNFGLIFIICIKIFIRKNYTIVLSDYNGINVISSEIN